MDIARANFIRLLKKRVCRLIGDDFHREAMRPRFEFIRVRFTLGPVVTIT